MKLQARLKNEIWRYGLKTSIRNSKVAIRSSNQKKLLEQTVEFRSKLKAPLIAREFQQIENIKFGETYAAAAQSAQFSSIIILLAVVTHFSLELHQMLVVTAFIHRELEKEFYIDIPNENDSVCR